MTRRVVLNFHGIGPVPPHVRADERLYWLPVERFRPIADEVAARRVRGQDIAITFDDGNLSDLEIAAPLLAERGLRAIFFVLTGRLGNEDYLNAKGVQDLVEMGMEIGLHGRDHVDWRRADADALSAEICEARRTLAGIVGLPVRDVGIPFGAYNRRVMRYLARQGFDTVYTSDGGAARAGARVQPRLSLRSDTSEAELSALLNGTESIRDRLRRCARRALKQHVV